MRKRSFLFSDYKFFDGFEEDVKQLGLPVDYLYKKLEDYATIFYMPKFP